MVRALLAAGADANAAVTSGETVLMTCARTGSADAVEALVGRGRTGERRGVLRTPDGAHVGGGRSDTPRS